MAKGFRVDIVTRERTVLSKDVVSLVAPGVEGYLGVRAGHAPLMTELTVGKITLRDPRGEEERLALSGGFLEVRPDHTTVLAETAERPGEIDADRARQAAERARARLGGDESVDLVRARLALMRALNRLDLA